MVRVVPDTPIDTSIRTVTIHGYERAYRMAGSGPVLLLLHGIGDSSESWEPLMAALAQHFTVIAPDMLGHGQFGQAACRLLRRGLCQRHA